MTRRALGWTALAVFLLGVNTGVMFWLKGRRGEAPLRDSRRSADPPPEVTQRPRAATPEEAVGPAPETRALMVGVTDASGAPLSGAAVRVLAHRRALRSPFPNPVLADGVTGADGTARFEGLPLRARWRVEAEAAGRAPGAATGPGPEITVALSLAGTIAGRVLEAGTGVAVSGATVHGNCGAGDPGAGFTVTTAEDGSFSAEGVPPGAWELRVASPLHEPPGTMPKGVLVEGGTETLVIHVRRGLDVAGRVMYAGSDRPLSGGSIRIEGWAGHLLPPRWVREAAVDSEGRFRIDGLPREATYPVCTVISTDGSVTTAALPRPRVDAVTGLQAGEVTVAIPWNSPAGLEYRGRITDGSGAPVAGARVVVGDGVLGMFRVLDGGGLSNSRQTMTDEDGRWALEAQGHVGGEVLVLHSGFAPGHFLLPYRSRSRTFDFVLGEARALLVMARDPAGRPVAGVEVAGFLRHQDPLRGRVDFGDVLEGMRANPVTDGQGRAVVGPLGPGSWYLVGRSADGGLAGRAPVLLEEGTGGVVELAMEALPRVEGRVAALDGAGVAGAVVSVLDGMTRERFETATDGAGRFSLAGVLPAMWPATDLGVTVALRAEGWRVGSSMRQVAAGERADWVVMREGEAGEGLVVRAVDGGGRPVMEVSWEIRFAGGRGGQAEGWGGDVPGQGVISIPLVRGKGAVLEVRAAGGGEGRVHLDDLPPGTTTVEVVVD